MPSVTVAHFHQLWAELHRRPSICHLPSPISELAWLARFANRIRCAGCRRHWLEVVAKLPPTFSSRAAYFRWTVRAHNAINRRLGKPIIPLRRARSLWNFTA